MKSKVPGDRYMAPVTVNLVKFCHDYLADREIVRIFAPNQLLLT